MIKLGITGGIGSGKSVVSHLLKLMEIPVYISDDEAKRLTVNDPDIRKELINLLGNDVYLDGNLNKPLVANYLFENPENAKKINTIIHPRVKEDLRVWVERHSGNAIIAMESAILIEAGFREEIDKLVMVYSSIESRINRILSRDNLSREAVLKRVNNQLNDEEKIEFADFIILNDHNKAIMPQLFNILNIISTLEN